MTIGLQQLTDEEIKYLDVLYLAAYAPEKDAIEPPPMDPKVGVNLIYNYEIYRILKKLGLKITPCRDLPAFLKTIKNYNYVFTLYNWASFRNSELFVSSECEYNNIPYLGAPPNIRALAEDKYLFKIIARQLGIQATPGTALYDLNEIPFQGPYFIKPRFGSASKGISVDCVHQKWSDLAEYVDSIIEKKDEFIIEQCIPGTDLTVPVLGGDPPIILPPTEEISQLPFGIATFRQKRLLDKGRKRVILTDENIKNTITESVSRLCEHLKPFDYLRVDFRLNEKRDQVYILEFNICCNLGSHAAIVMSSKHAGFSHKNIINHIIAHSVRRQK